MALSDTLHTLRLRNFFTRTFVPRFQALTKSASQTRLNIMLWSPQSPGVWSHFTKSTLTELERLGHAVFYSEYLGVSTSMRSKKGVEYKATDTLDLIVVAQPNYAPIGDVRDYIEFRIVDSKMLLFIDQAAADRPLYETALIELASHYNNIESFEFPNDLTQGTLLNKMLAKIGVVQMVKQLALQRRENWGLSLPTDTTSNNQNGAPAPMRYNLLELYRLNRDEVETLLDSTTLFILAYADHIGKMTLRTLWQDMKLEAAQMQPRLMRLQHGKMLDDTDGTVTVTALGKRILKDCGL